MASVSYDQPGPFDVIGGRRQPNAGGRPKGSSNRDSSLCGPACILAGLRAVTQVECQTDRNRLTPRDWARMHAMRCGSTPTARNDDVKLRFATVLPTLQVDIYNCQTSPASSTGTSFILLQSLAHILQHNLPVSSLAHDNKPIPGVALRQH